MFLIAARRQDEAAAFLAARWKRRGAAVLTAKDLSESGWRLKVPACASSRLIAGGRAFHEHELSGVLMLLPAVQPDQLPHIAIEDRSYVSAEMTAFLLAWLTGLSCPLLNRPTPGCLCGPGWRIEYWIHFAASLGIPVDPFRRSTATPILEERNSRASVTVVGHRSMGSVHPLLAEHARRLAALAGVDLLEARFTGNEKDSKLTDVALCPDVSNPEVADAILGWFDSRPVC